MSATMNLDGMLPSFHATPNGIGPVGGGVPIQTDFPDTGVI